MKHKTHLLSVHVEFELTFVFLKKTIVFITENIENIAPGWKAKESYQLINDKEFIESFELAEPNKPFEIYSKATLKKK